MTEHLKISLYGADAERARTYWSERRTHLMRMLRRFSDQDIHFGISVLRADDERLEASAVLSLPSGTVVAHTDGSSIEEALDLLTEKLVHQLQQHFAEDTLRSRVARREE